MVAGRTFSDSPTMLRIASTENTPKPAIDFLTISSAETSTPSEGRPVFTQASFDPSICQMLLHYRGRHLASVEVSRVLRCSERKSHPWKIKLISQLRADDPHPNSGGSRVSRSSSVE